MVWFSSSKLAPAVVYNLMIKDVFEVYNGKHLYFYYIKKQFLQNILQYYYFYISIGFRIGTSSTTIRIWSEHLFTVYWNSEQSFY